MEYYGSERQLRVGIGICVVVFAVSIPVAVAAEALHIEPGLWDVTYSFSLQGQPPAQLLANLPPEKRAAVEQAWAARAGQTKTSTSQICVTAEEIAKGTAFESAADAHKPGCERTVTTETATQWNMVERCSGKGGAAERSVQISAGGPRSVSGAMNAVRGEGSAASGLGMTFAGKWAAKDCGDVP